MKKRHNIYNKVMTLLLVGMGLTSCNDFLDKAPDERLEIKTVDDAVELFTSSYPDNNYGWVCELSSDNVMDLNSVHVTASEQSSQEPVHYNLTSSGRQDDEMYCFEPVKSSTSSDTPAAIWTGFYGTINSINEGLAALDRLEKEGATIDAKFRAARAEGLLLRAYSHFILVNVFCQAYKNDELSKNDIGVPYVTEPVTTFKTHYDRENVTATYQHILKDMEAGLKDVSNINYQKPKWHFNVDAAHAFAARVYLFLRKWDKVIEHANAVLGNNNDQLLDKLFDYTPLDDCTYLSDYANVWQSPYIYNNIMLLDTYSTILRKARYRYGQGSLVARAIFYHNAPMWPRWIANPTMFVSGLGGNGYGTYYPAWISEQFEYSDKVAGIGYAHTIRREFTLSELLLTRAEAYIMTDRIALGTQDLITYQSSTQKFSPSSMETYGARNGLVKLTDAMIQDWFAKDTKDNFNCFDDWNFVTNMSPDYVIKPEAVPYMNCVNYFRRFELNFSGMRFFDLKRWGMEYTHEYGLNNEKFTMKWNDPRRAIEIPQDAIAAGVAPSRPLNVDSVNVSTIKVLSATQFWGEDYLTNN